MGTRTEEDADNPLQARVAKIDGRPRAGPKQTDRMIWLRRWAAVHHSSAFQYGIGGLLGVLLTRLTGFAALSTAVIAPVVLGALTVPFITAFAYKRLLHAEITRFIAESGSVRHARIFQHVEHVLGKNENLRDTLSRLVEAERIRLQDGRYFPIA